MNSDPIPSTDERTDPDLMALAAQGSAAAFAELIHRHQRSLANFFRRMGVYTDAEDLVQETFVRVFGARQRYRPTAKFTTFLYTVARNVRTDHIRRAVRQRALKDSMQADAADAGGGVARHRPAHLDVETALAGLSDKLREVVVMGVYQGLRYQEIADVLGVPLGTVKSRMNLAIRELRKVLNEEE